MPSRLGVAGVVLFWLATTGHVVYHDVWPRLFADAPPAVRIDLADEATQLAPTRWVITHNDEPVGALATRMEHVPADDTFRFVNTYRQLKFTVPANFGSVALDFPKLETAVRVTRAGDLLEQNLTGEVHGDIVIRAVRFPIGDAAAEVRGTVRDGLLTGTCVIRYPASSPAPTVDRPLEPVPVPAGQVLNPLTPVSRLRDVRPGRRWVIRQVDPLQDSLNILFREVLSRQSQVAAAALGQSATNRELVAEVRRDPETLARKTGDPVECWVIDYRGDGVQARTWVARDDGRVMRQEADGLGERLRFERDD